MPRLTEADFAALPKHIRDRCVVSEPAPLPSLKAKGRKPAHVWGQMNQAEKDFAAELDRRMAAGEVLWWRFECWTFRLADDLRLTPDFCVLRADGSLVCYDVKAEHENKKTGKRKMHIEEDALAKMKVAAAHMPLQFVAVAWSKSAGWVERVF